MCCDAICCLLLVSFYPNLSQPNSTAAPGRRPAAAAGGQRDGSWSMSLSIAGGFLFQSLSAYLIAIARSAATSFSTGVCKEFVHAMQQLSGSWRYKAFAKHKTATQNKPLTTMSFRNQNSRLCKSWWRFMALASLEVFFRYYGSQSVLMSSCAFRLYFLFCVFGEKLLLFTFLF